MPTRPAAPAAILAALVAFSLNSAAAQMTRGEITLEQARAVLGAHPVAIPGYAVKFYRLSGRAVLVRQELDSGKVIEFRDDRDGRPTGLTRHPFLTGQDAAKPLLNDPPRSEVEDAFWARRTYREIDGVSVRYLGSRQDRIPYDLLDRLAPIQ
jgi:hypothetical protein